MRLDRNRFAASMLLVALMISVLFAALPLPALDVSSLYNGLDTPKNMLSYQSNGHGLFFETGGWLMSNANYALRVKFLGANTVTPQSSQISNAADRPAALSQVTYANLWNGISLTYDAPAGTIARSTYTLEPGADPTAIRLEYNTQTQLRSDGALETRFANGAITESAPVAWQDINGQRVSVDVAFLIRPDQSVGFQLGAYDLAQRLIIDPAIAWNTFLGAAGADDFGYSLAIDSADNIYIGGQSYGNWGSPLIAFHNSGSNNSDEFVAKLNSSGNLVWNTILGSNSTGGNDLIRDLTLDASGNIYVTGGSPDVWQDVAAPITGFGGTSDAFVAQLDNTGAVQWYTFLGGSNMDSGYGIARDSNGNLYVAGGSYASWGSPVRAFATGNDPFAAKLNSSGTLLWNTFLGGSGSSDNGRDVAVDASGNVYVLGDADASWSPATGWVGGTDAFVAKLDSSGAITWAKAFGSSLTDQGIRIALDASNNILVSGISQGPWGTPANPHPGAYTWSTFAAKFDSNMTPVWNTFYPGDEPGSILPDGSNVTYTGYAYSTFENPVNPFQGGSDAFVITLNGSTGALVSNTFVGGSGWDQGYSFAKNSNGSYVVSGLSFSTWGSPVNPFAGNSDAMVAMTGSLTNANLSALSISAGTLSPSFAAATISYTASVPYATSSVTVTPLAEGTIQVRVNSGSWASVTSGSASSGLALSTGSNTINVKVTAADGVTTKTYTITVTRQLNNDADLSSLSISAGTLSPAFSAATTSYTASALYATSSITVTPTFSDSNAAILARLNSGSWVQLTSGSASSALTLNVGSNTLEVKVEAQDGVATKTYTITFTRGAASTVKTLGGLSISADTLTPAFATATTTYTASDLFATSSLTVTPTQTDANASIQARVNGGSWSTVTSGSASGALTLNVGSNTVEVKVTAQDGTTTQTYTITFTRGAADTNSALGGITLPPELTDLTPSPFDTGTLTYTGSVNNTTSTLSIPPTRL